MSEKVINGMMHARAKIGCPQLAVLMGCFFFAKLNKMNKTAICYILNTIPYWNILNLKTGVSLSISLHLYKRGNIILHLNHVTLQCLSCFVKNFHKRKHCIMLLVVNVFYIIVLWVIKCVCWVLTTLWKNDLMWVF